MEKDTKLQKKKGEMSVRDAAELESKVIRRDAADNSGESEPRESEDSSGKRRHEDHVDHVYTEEAAQDPSL